MTRRPAILLSAVLLALAACERAASPESTSERAAQTGGAAAGHVRGHGEAEAEPERPADGPLTAPVAVGAEAPAELESVDPAEILRDPESYRGKTVSVRGAVKGFCHHARAWYAIEVPGASPPYLRLITRPAFSVPANAMGTIATGHGVVEVQEVPAERVEHYEQEHRLGSGPGTEPGAPAVRVVIRAAGATFEPAPGG